MIEKIHDFTDDELLNIELIVKWGFDGTTGVREHKMKFDADDGTFSDKSIFVTSLVPIQAIAAEEKVLFQNKSTSSTRYCRPVRIQYVKETAAVTVQEKEYINKQMAALAPYVTVINRRTVKMLFKMHLTMVDGKAINSLTCTKSTQTCYICKATPKEMNDVDRISSKPAPTTTDFQHCMRG